MTSDDFVHLHVHTEFSMLDGAAKVDPLLDEVARLGQRAVAQTDHGQIFGAFEFHAKARARGINPIIGMEGYLAPGTRFDKGVVRDDKRDAEKTDKYSHMTLLATDLKGYQNLVKLSSTASIEGQYYNKARFDRELLSQHAEGLIGTSGCVGGEVAQHIYRDRYQAAKETASEFADIFGRENFFIEIMRHDIEIERKTGSGLIRLARELDLPLLATNDSHYVAPGEALSHAALLCIQTGATLDDPRRFKFDTDEFYIKSGASMRRLFADVPDACDNTLLVAERCDVTIPSGQRLLPEFEIPEHHTQDSYFRERVDLGLTRRYPEEVTPEVRARADYEADVITSMGFSAYFSIVEDLVAHAKSIGIRVGPGRGCLTADSSVATPDGMVRLVDVQTGDLVYDENGNPTPVAATHVYDCDEPLLRLTSAQGSITMTDDHHVLVVRDDQRVWLPANEVQLGDLTIKPRCFVEVSTLELTFNSQPVVLDAEIGFLAGCYFTSNFKHSAIPGIMLTRFGVLPSKVEVLATWLTHNLSPESWSHLPDAFHDGLARAGAPARATTDQYAPITSVVRVPPEGKVYDITVPTTSSYLSHFVVHNSAAGSMVSYVLGITELDPLVHGLVFERFLNPDRVSMPDIDLDFDERRRGEMIEYAVQKYGKDRVAQIITYGTIKGKQALKDSARVLGHPYAMGESLTKLLPDPVMGKDMALRDVFDKSSKRYSEAEDFRKFYKSDPAVSKVVDTALGLEGLKRQWGVHAAGVIISGDPLTDHVPLWMRPADGAILTQYDMRNCEDIGLLKMDFLGLRNLTVIDDTVDLIKSNRGQVVVMEDLPLDDSPTYELLRRGASLGVFQLEGGPMRGLMKAIEVNNFNDISALLALYRPGPMGVGAHMDYADRKNGRKPIIPIHAELEVPLKEILDETYSVIVYQEQVAAVAQALANYTAGQADLLRRAMGKKKKEILDKEYVPFRDGMIANGYSDDAVATIWSVLVPFADYAFNKAHTAGYGLVSYWTAYLKANYPSEYMAALLTSVSDNKVKTGIYLNECRVMDIPVLSPDVNESLLYYAASGTNIRFGLGAIKGIGNKLVDDIMSARADQPFKSFEDFVTRTNSSRGQLESLVRAGAFDSFGYSRLGLSLSIDQALSRAVRDRKAVKSGQFDLFGSLGLTALPPLTISDDEWPQKMQLGFERELLGLYVSAHPLDGLDLTHENARPIIELFDDSSYDGEEVLLAGLITNVEHKVSRAGKPWALVTLEDHVGVVEVLFFARTYDQARDQLKTDEVVVLGGRLDKKDGELKVLGDALRPVRAAQAQLPGVDDYSLMVIQLNTDSVDPELVQAVKREIGRSSGSLPVAVELPSGKRYPVEKLGVSASLGVRIALRTIPEVADIVFE